MRRRGFLNMGTDYAVPLDRDREMMAFYRQRLEEELPERYIIFGHLGDAHLHVNMLPATQAEAEKATQMLKEFAVHAVELGGTVSAEHGLGKRKASLLGLQFSEAEIAEMRRVKRLLDPQELLGRGTIFGGGRGAIGAAARFISLCESTGRQSPGTYCFRKHGDDELIEAHSFPQGQIGELLMEVRGTRCSHLPLEESHPLWQEWDSGVSVVKARFNPEPLHGGEFAESLRGILPVGHASF